MEKDFSTLKPYNFIMLVNNTKDSELLKKIYYYLVDSKYKFEFHIYKEIAKNTKTPSEILEEILKLPLYNREVAKNPNASAILLAKIAEEGGKWERHDVAKNPNTPSDVLEKLSHDDSYWVRGEVCHNPNTPLIVVKKLCYDKHDYVVSCAKLAIKKRG